jgi:methionyl-tRNA formyltransferase
VKPDVLERVPMINVHFSLLPRWRGAAPVERAILAGDTRTGVCVMDVEEGLDTGGVHRKVDVDIGDDETADELRGTLVTIGTDLLVDALAEGIGEAEPQVGEETYAHKIDPAELVVDWSRPALDVHRLIRIGGAWTTHQGKRLKLWRSTLAPDPSAVEVPAGDGPVGLLEVQPEGRARMRARDWANGARVTPGTHLGT